MTLIRNLILISIIALLPLGCEKYSSDTNDNPTDPEVKETILDSIVVISMVFDSHGTAWIGTLNQGVVKYDTTETIVYNSSNSPLTGSPVWDITVDRDDKVWIGSDGLYKFDGETFTSYNTSNSAIPEDIVWSVAADSNNNIWVASSRFQTGGLAMFDGESFTVYTPENSVLPVNSINSVAVDRENNIWIASTETVNNSYLVRIAGDTWTVFDSDDFNRQICWISEIRINSSNQVVGAIDNSFVSSETDKPDIFIFDGEIIETFQLQGLIFAGFRSLLVDSQDNMWCTFGNGYATFDGETWTRKDAETVESNGSSYYKYAYFTTCEAPDGTIWLGRDDGVEIQDKR